MADIVLNPEIVEALSNLEKNESSENIITFIKKVIGKKERSWAALVLEFGIKLMSNSTDISKLENFTILEEFYLSALECKAFDWADLALLMINKQIPRSPKSIRYLAMFKEAKGELQEAKNLYRELIKSNPEDPAGYRRLAAFLRDSNLKDEAIETLNWGLKMNMADTQSWFELAEIYVSNMNYTKAAYWFEEVLLQKPTNYVYNLKYGELMYSIGGGDNLILARKYFSKAVALLDEAAGQEAGIGKNSVRAIWCLLETCTRLESLGRKYQDEINQDLIDMCKDKLAKVYSKKSKLDIDELK